ncbi:hypothetical protein H0H87_007140 [Tephrocybe sp. NHM501043]|nr:hypothetical protein H0H87_007140 [Tephrocybe sp. NHM501043]
MLLQELVPTVPVANSLMDGGIRWSVFYIFSLWRKRAHDSSPCSPSQNALKAFFENRDGFDYDASSPAWDEFHRLARYLGWRKSEKSTERNAFKDTLVLQFNATYGTNANDMASWATLCAVLSIDPIPDDLEGCRAAVQGVYVNLVDLVDLPNSYEPLQVFDTEEELSTYTLENHKVFPKENAYAGGLLRHLLRHIMAPGA